MTSHHGGFDVEAHTRRLGPADAGEVLTLQLAAWVHEAIVNDTLRIPPLHETLADVEAQLADPATTAWGVRDDAGRLLAMSRSTPGGDGTTATIGRLGVVPDRRGTGLGSAVLRLTEARVPDTVRRLQLVTGIGSTDNHRFYAHHGYRLVGRDPALGTVHLVKDRPVR